jgi:geranylgeranyl diphosphate synthase type II
METEKWLLLRRDQVEEILEKYLPAEEGDAATLLSAMNYSVRAGGKRLRPILLLELCRLYGGSEEVASPFAAALECIHSYSLVHDDLPAMDDDMLRRGKPTTHAVYGEAMGILAGDGLLNYAFEIIAGALSDMDPSVLPGGIRAFYILSRAAGAFGMIGGQCVDIEAEGKEEISDGLIDSIYHNKTGALIASAMSMGTALAMAHAEDIDRAAECGYALGRAFQIRDDILDVTGSEEVLGKPIGSDERNLKPTYVAMHGIEKAQEEVRFQTEYAKSLVDKMPGDTEQLRALMDYLTGREM